MKINGCQCAKVLAGSVLIIALISFVWILQKIPDNRPEEQGSKENKKFFSQWHKIKSFKKRRGVALVVHGLNLRPEKMMTIIICLNRIGIDVLNVSLRGHGDNYLANKTISEGEARLESFRTVDYTLWLREVSHGYDKAKARARRKNIPFYFVGYSLGGLLGCNLSLAASQKSFDVMILFAPALNVKAEAYLLKAMMPFPDMVIDSLSPPSYRANPGTPMAAYKALFEAIDDLERNMSQALNRPTLLLIDENDEFISLDGIRDIIKKYKLDQWQLRIVRKDPVIADDVSRHLIIDQDGVGETTWKQITDEMIHFLHVN